MSDPGKGDHRRPGDDKAFKENFDRIFRPKSESTPGRRYYRQTPNGFVEIPNPPPRYSEDLMFEGTFVSPVDGSVIRNKRDLVNHNRRNEVEQTLPGKEQDWEAIRKENHDKAFGKAAKAERVEAIKAAIENPVVKDRDVFEG